MKSIKFLIAALWCLIFVQPAFAQDEVEEEIKFDPIHSTLLMSNSQFSFEEKYEKNSSVYLSGDDLIFKSKKSETAGAEFKNPLPLNFKQDFTISLNLSAKKFSSTSVFVISLNEWYFFVSPTITMILTGDTNSLAPKYLFQTEKKWKFPKSPIKDEIIIKIERRKKNLILFINNEYVGEATISKSILGNATGITLSYTNAKGGEIALKSITLDQGGKVIDEE